MLETSFLATVTIRLRTVSLRWISPKGYPVPSPFFRNRQTPWPPGHPGAACPAGRRCSDPGWDHCNTSPRNIKFHAAHCVHQFHKPIQVDGDIEVNGIPHQVGHHILEVLYPPWSEELIFGLDSSTSVSAGTESIPIFWLAHRR